jgi:DNA invertase Pin-like site-specific DNA recombinase
MKNLPLCIGPKLVECIASHPGRPVTVGKQPSKIEKLHRSSVSKAEIARRLDIGRTSVRRILGERNRT